ncbi:Transcription initiation factor TFIID subunit 9, partial [Pseudocercospora fuligena]
MATNGHPATPPPSDPSIKPEAPKPSEPEVPLTSAQDDGTSKRPRDARLIHAILSNLGIHSYQERVPLQLLDFAYRYTSGVLNDSLRLSAEGYASQQTGTGGGRRNNQDDMNNITMSALRGAIASRHGHTFVGPLPKEYMMEQAAERNRIQLPKVERGYGVQLPPEKYCLTGVGWGLKDEWESDEDVVIEEAPVMSRSASQRKDMDEDEDERMGGL